MTAPDHDATRWGATPPGYEATNTAWPAANQLPATPKLAADDLRDRIRDAIHAGNFSCPDYHAADCDLCAEQADAAMAMVQCGCADADRTYAELERHFAEQLDAKDAEIKRLHVEVSRFRRAWEDAMADGDQQAVQRLSLRNQLNQERQRAEAAERELTTLRHQQIGDL